MMHSALCKFHPRWMPRRRSRCTRPSSPPALATSGWRCCPCSKWCEGAGAVCGWYYPDLPCSSRRCRDQAGAPGTPGPCPASTHVSGSADHPHRLDLPAVPGDGPGGTLAHPLLRRLRAAAVLLRGGLQWGRGRRGGGGGREGGGGLAQHMARRQAKSPTTRQQSKGKPRQAAGAAPARRSPWRPTQSRLPPAASGGARR